MLFQDNLSKQDIKKLKEVTVDLLAKIKAKISELDHWTNKQETKAAVDNLIRDVCGKVCRRATMKSESLSTAVVFMNMFIHGIRKWRNQPSIRSIPAGNSRAGREISRPARSTL